MSDAAVTAIVAGVVNVAGLLVGFLTLWLKVKHGVEKVNAVDQKVDVNTALTTEAKDAASRAASTDAERAGLLKTVADHDTRIASLEAQMAALKVSVEAVDRSVQSSRHEMRSHLQTVTNKLDLLGARQAIAPPPREG